MKEEQERTPLRTILQNFLNHIESLEIQRVEDSYDKEFQVLILFRWTSQDILKLGFSPTADKGWSPPSLGFGLGNNNSQ